MGEEYLYNRKTDTLHIRGYCQHTRGLCTDYIAFATEDDGRAIGMCKLCQKKREQIMKANK